MKKSFVPGSRVINAAFRQRGASLLEGIAYLGIAAIVILGAISLLMSAFGGAESNRLIEEVTAIRTSVRKLYMSQPNNFGTPLANITGDVAAANAIPSTLRVTTSGGTTTVNNAWGGTVQVSVGAAANTFTIDYTSVPNDVCINALSGSTGWKTVFVNTVSLTVPVSPADAASNCNAGTNAIQWTAS